MKGTDLQVCVAVVTGDIVHCDQNGGRFWYVNLIACRSPQGDVTSTSAPCIVANQDGRLEIFVKTQNDLVQHHAQSSAGIW